MDARPEVLHGMHADSSQGMAAGKDRARRSGNGRVLQHPCTQFTRPIARGLSLIAIVVGGADVRLRRGSKRTLAGITFGLGMAMGMANFLAWLF